MKGAGHNFGIVTSLKLKIYPKKIETWHYHNYFWTQDKLETVLGELNKLQEKTQGLMNDIYFSIIDMFFYFSIPSLKEVHNKKNT